jgi:hypothetical protein
MPYRPTYVPADLTVWNRPMRAEPCRGLNGVETPGGNMVIVWNAADATGPSGFGTAIHAAVLNSPHLLGVDSVVTADMIRDVLTLPGVPDDNIVRRPSIMMLGDELAVTVTIVEYGLTATDYTLQVLVADNPENPLNWTVRGTIAAGVSTGGAWGYPPDGGSIYEMDSGRWVFSGTWVDDNVIRSGIQYSDDRGETWSSAIQDTLVNDLDNLSGQYTSCQIDVHPRTGRLFFVNCHTVEAGTKPGFGPYARWYSSADGATWGYRTNDPEDGLLVYSPFVHTGTELYALSYAGAIDALGDQYANTVAVPPDTNTWEWQGGTVALWPEPWPPVSVPARLAKRGIVTAHGDAYIFYQDNRVTSLFLLPPEGGWIVGSIGFTELDLCA